MDFLWEKDGAGMGPSPGLVGLGSYCTMFFLIHLLSLLLFLIPFLATLFPPLPHPPILPRLQGLAGLPTLRSDHSGDRGDSLLPEKASTTGKFTLHTASNLQLHHD